MEEFNKMEFQKTEIKSVEVQPVEVKSVEVQQVGIHPVAVKQYEVEKKPVQSIRTRKLIYYGFGFLEILFAFRLVLKVLGASSGSIFVSVIYSITNVFLFPFSGIFSDATTQGLETKAVFEPHLLIGMVVYALVAFGIVRLIEIIKNHKHADVIE